LGLAEVCFADVETVVSKSCGSSRGC
jgi:hypothetical protein